MQNKIFRWARRAPWFCNLVRCSVLCQIISLSLVLLSPVHALADTIVLGYVINSVTGEPVVGADISVKRSNEELGSGNSKTDGSYAVAIRIQNRSELSTLTIHTNHKDHIASSMNIQITQAGAPVERNYKIVLLPKGLSGCLCRNKHTVVVGHFRSPLGQSFTELPGRIAEALQFDLLTRLQAERLPPELQPTFEPCEQAQPRALQDGKSIAQALQADVFLSGNVAVRDSKYDVSTYVSDAYELFTRPEPYTNPSVDLNNPSMAQMDPKTQAAVLAAVAAGLEKVGNCEAGITVTIAAERVLGKVDPMITAIRERCQQTLPHVGLLPGGK